MATVIIAIVTAGRTSKNSICSTSHEILELYIPVVVSPNSNSLCAKSASSWPAALATAAAPAPNLELSVGGGACVKNTHEL